MWILHFLPDTLILWFCNCLLLAGAAVTVAGLFAHRIPMVWRYQLPFRILGIALLTLGVYFRGGLAVEQQWRERVAAVEARLAQAQEQAQKANVQIDTRSQQRMAKIRQRTEYIRQYVDREVVKYDAQCVIPEPFIQAHNRAAEAPAK
jgi:preprotein translocase subunit SecF